VRVVIYEGKLHIQQATEEGPKSGEFLYILKQSLSGKEWEATFIVREHNFTTVPSRHCGKRRLEARWSVSCIR